MVDCSLIKDTRRIIGCQDYLVNATSFERSRDATSVRTDSNRLEAQGACWDEIRDDAQGKRYCNQEKGEVVRCVACKDIRLRAAVGTSNLIRTEPGRNETIPTDLKEACHGCLRQSTDRPFCFILSLSPGLNSTLKLLCTTHPWCSARMALCWT